MLTDTREVRWRLKKLRKTTIRNKEKKSKKKLVRLFQKIMLKEAHALLPEEPEALISEAMDQFIPRERRNSAFEKCLAACKKGSIENG